MVISRSTTTAYRPFLAAEVLVDHRFGHLGAGRHLLHTRGVEAALGEQPAGHGDELRRFGLARSCGVLGRAMALAFRCGPPTGWGDGARPQKRAEARARCGGAAGGWGLM